jgi:hypothetical protein
MKVNLTGYRTKAKQGGLEEMVVELSVFAYFFAVHGDS